MRKNRETTIKSLKPTRKIRETKLIYSCAVDEINGVSVKDLTNYFNNKMIELSYDQETIESAKITIDKYDEYCNINVESVVTESEEEFQVRLKKYEDDIKLFKEYEKKRKKEQIVRDQRELERLSKKLGKKIV